MLTYSFTKRSKLPALLLLILILGACTNTVTVTEAPVAVRAVEAVYGEIRNTMLFSGRTAAPVDLVVTSFIPGRVAELLVQLGDRVIVGQALLRLEGDDVQVGVAQARAARDMAQANFLIVSGGTSQTQLLQAEAERNVAQWTYDEVARVYVNMQTERGDATPPQLLQLDSAVQLAGIVYDDAVQQYQKMLRAYEDPTVSPQLVQLHASREVAQLSYGEVARNYGNMETLYELGAVSGDQLKSLQLQLNSLREQMDAANEGYNTAVSELQRGADLQLRSADEQLKTALQGQSSAGTDALKNAELQLNSSRLRLDTANEAYRLASERILPESVAVAAAQLAQAQAAYDQALLQQSRLLITAPLDGVITYIGCSAQEMIGTSSPLFKICDAEELQVDLLVTEREALCLQGQREAEVIFDDEIISASITYVAVSPDLRSGLYQVRLAFANPEQRYLVGQSCEVCLVTEQRDNILILPRSAVVEQNNTSYVYLLEEDRARLVTVTIGSLDLEHVEISSGLQVGQKVANSAQSRLSDGALILIYNQDATGGK